MPSTVVWPSGSFRRARISKYWAKHEVGLDEEGGETRWSRRRVFLGDRRWRNFRTLCWLSDMNGRLYLARSLCGVGRSTKIRSENAGTRLDPNQTTLLAASTAQALNDQPANTVLFVRSRRGGPGVTGRCSPAARRRRFSACDRIAGGGRKLSYLVYKRPKMPCHTGRAPL